VTFEKQRIIDELKNHSEKISVSKLHHLIRPIPYYRLTLEYVPELEKEGKIIVTKNGTHTYIQLNLKHKSR
jgi:hypothetical protein